MTKRAALALILPFAGPVLAEGIVLQSPIDCDLNGACFIQQYMDRDPTEGVTDYQCAGLSYDGHKGTDFAIPSSADIKKGISVLAAAEGVVGGTRDGMQDIEFSDEVADQVKDRECGNGIRIDHGDGWVTQYCHLRKGSVSVKTGDRVQAGSVIGQVGMSGRAAFPHVHFSVRKDGETIDPFDPDNTLTCASPGDSTLWAETLPYRPGGLISLGFSDRVPDYASVKAGSAAQTELTTDAPALVIYGFAFGIRAGDIMRLSITGPKGTVIAEDVKMEKPQARSFRAVGKKRRHTQWPEGDYEGAVTLLRDDVILNQLETVITLR